MMHYAQMQRIKRFFGLPEVDCPRCKEPKREVTATVDEWQLDIVVCLRCEGKMVGQYGDQFALRDPACSEYQWVPEYMREVCAQAALAADHRGPWYVELAGMMWVATGHVMLKTNVDASEIPTWRAKHPDPKLPTKSPQEALADFISRPLLVAAAVEDRHQILLGDSTYLDLDAWKLVKALYPEAQAWISGLHPVVFRLPGGDPVAVVMPMSGRNP